MHTCTRTYIHTPTHTYTVAHVDLAIVGDLIPRERDYASSANGAQPDMSHWPLNDICTGVGQVCMHVYMYVDMHVCMY